MSNRIPLVVVLVVLALAAIAFVYRDLPSGSEETATTTQNGQPEISNVRILRRADSSDFSATMCQNQKTDEEIIEVVLSANRVSPECFFAGEDQRLRLENETDTEIVVYLDRLPPAAVNLASTTLPVDNSKSFDIPFGQFLGKGVHVLKISDGRTLEIVMVD